MMMAPIATDTHANIVMEGVATLASADGSPYMPDPIMLPTTMLMAVIRPKSRFSEELSGSKFLSFFNSGCKSSQSFR